MPAGCMNGLVIKTDDLTKDSEELSAKGISVGKIKKASLSKFATITDPDGNRLSLHQGS